MKNSEFYELYMDSWNKKNLIYHIYILYVKCISEYSEKQTNKQKNQEMKKKVCTRIVSYYQYQNFSDKKV